MNKVTYIKTFLKKWNFLIVLYLITVVVALTIVSNLNETQLKAGDVSQKTYKATKDVENEVATKRNQELAKASVETVYVIDDTINQQIFKRVDDFFRQVELSRDVYTKKLNSTDGALKSSSGEDEETPALTDKEILGNEVDIITSALKGDDFDIKKIPNSDFEYIIAMPNEDYAIFKTTVEKCVKELTSEGITISEYDAGEFYAVDEENVDSISIYESMLINNIVGMIIEPNVEVDVDATAKAIDEAVAKVQPVMYLKNQTIVNDGDIVTEEQLQVLAKLNLVGNIKDLDFVDVASYIILILVGIISIGLTLSKKENIKFLERNYKMLFLALNIVMLLGILITPKDYAILSPIFILVFLLCNLFNNYIALITAIMYSIFYVLLDKITFANALFLIAAITFISVIVSRDIQRFRLVKVSLVVSIACGMLYFMMYTIVNGSVLDVKERFINMSSLTLFVLCSIIFANGILPFIEGAFNLITTNRLQDLMNQERPIFKRMLAETPGTLHHSVLVANLCEAGASAIGADAMLAKTYAYYHDIGKLSAPMYFIENQVGYNYHDELSYKESARIIKSHVEHGVQFRKEYKLPSFLDDGILSHHGTSVLQYFYQKALQDETQKKVDINDYKYNGFLPTTKELTILMLADIVEASVRSIIPKVKDISEVEEFIDKVIDGKIKEGQFDDSQLTFGDIAKVKEAFLVVLKGMYHNRITYPDQKKPVQK